MRLLWGSVPTPSESLHWKLTMGEKSLAALRNQTGISVVPGFSVQHSVNWAVLPHLLFWWGEGGGLSIKSEGGSGQDPFDQKLGWILYWHGLIHNEVSRKVRSKVHLLVFFANNKMTKQPQAPVKAHKPYAYQYCWVQLCFSTSKYYNKVPSHIVLWARVKKSADLRFVKTKDHSSNRAGNRVSLLIFHDVA